MCVSFYIESLENMYTENDIENIVGKKYDRLDALYMNEQISSDEYAKRASDIKDWANSQYLELENKGQKDEKR